MELYVKYHETTLWSFIDHVRLSSNIYDDNISYTTNIVVGSQTSVFNIKIEEINKKEVYFRKEPFSSKLFRDIFEEMSKLKWPKPFLFPISSCQIYSIPEPFWQFYLEQDLYKINKDQVF